MSDMTPLQRERLIIGLQMEDSLRAINTAMRVRKLSFTLDFTHKDHLARLYVEMPGVPREGMMVVNWRTKYMFRVPSMHRDLAAGLNDINERLQAFDAAYLLAADKPPNQKPQAALQLHFKGARRQVMTLMKCNRGQSLTSHHFTMPDGTVP